MEFMIEIRTMIANKMTLKWEIILNHLGEVSALIKVLKYRTGKQRTECRNDEMGESLTCPWN